MSELERLEDNNNSTETLVDTVKTDLIQKFKSCIDGINTEVEKVSYENIRSYEEMNKILVNIRNLDPTWRIKGGFEKQGMWNQLDILEGILKERIRDIEIDEQDLEDLDLEGYGEFHQALADIRKVNPEWSINGTKRSLKK
jgi:hypothetical protein